MTESILHKSNSRGTADHGWLKSQHTFSFGGYYNPERINFGALRVLNDDVVDGGMGFGEHPHDNMEIISIPLEGKLKHNDSMGNVATIQTGEIQVMSAGTGIYHSEHNADKNKPVKFLQIWLFPNQRNVTPRYDQITINSEQNKLVQILSPNQDDDGVWIYQNAWFNLGRFSDEKTISYNLHAKENGVYAFIIKGEAQINGQDLEERDGYGLWNTEEIEVKVYNGTEILLMEVPMEIK
jgi:redox-sensitive bicupin YhaK (pirin superfamily)